MGRISETMATVNSFIRTVLAAVIVGAAGYAGWIAYDAYHSDAAAMRQKEMQLSEKEQIITRLNHVLTEKTGELNEKEARIGELTEAVEAGQQKIDRLETALHLLKVDHRLAQLTVLEQQTDAQTGRLYSKIAFREIRDDGSPIGELRTFRIDGDLVYLDYWVVKFDDRYVEQADMDRSTSICLFRRIFGESQEPKDGFVLDQVGSRPGAYARGGKPSEFEQSIWDDFWNIANDPEKAREMGIRAAHGEALAIRVRAGKSYRVMLRASDGLSIAPLDESERSRQPRA